MVNLNNIVISKDDFKTISNLLDGTDFHGVDYDKSVSLFKYGFVYDGRTGMLITTHSATVWNEKATPIHFAVVELSLDKIDDVFNEFSVQILSENNLTIGQWDELCDSYKINLIEISCGGLELKKPFMKMTASDLITYLKGLV